MSSIESVRVTRNLFFLALLFLQAMSGCLPNVGTDNESVHNATVAPTTESNQANLQKQVIEIAVGEQLEMVGESDHFQVFSAKKIIEPELLLVYEQALEVAHHYVTSELGLAFSDNQRLLVMVYPPGEYQEHLTIGKVTALPQDDSLRLSNLEPANQCGNMPLLELQLYPVEEIDLNQLVASYIHELIHYYLRANLGPSAQETSQNETICQYPFILEEALANLAKVLFYQDRQLDLELVDPQLFFVTGTPFARQELYPRNLSYGLWGYLAARLGNGSSTNLIKQNLSYLLSTFVDRASAAQVAGQSVSFDELLISLFPELSSRQCTDTDDLDTNLAAWVASYEIGQSFIGRDDYEQSAKVVTEEDPSQESHRRFQCHITQAPFFQQVQIEPMRAGQYAQIDISKAVGVDPWSGVVLALPPSLHLIAYSQPSNMIYSDLALFPDETGVSNNVYLPPDSTGVVVWSDGSDITGKPAILTLSMP